MRPGRSTGRRSAMRISLLALLLFGIPSAGAAARNSEVQWFTGLSLLNESAAGGIITAIGPVVKSSRNPLFSQDRPWEPRLDNGYPNVVYDEHNSLSAQRPWRLWYGDCVAGCGTQILLYADSGDGLAWEKPNLGMFNLSTVRPDLVWWGTFNNNIVMNGGGIGIYLDPHATSPAERYKAFGEGCFGPSPGNCTNIKGTAVSSDGFEFHDARNLTWPAPQRYDTHNNVVWDARGGRYVASTRDGFSDDPGRTTAVAAGAAGGAFSWSTDTAPTAVEKGSKDHQLYSQITFPFHNVWLGINSVYDATSAEGKVHCRLSWSTDPTDPKSWRWVDQAGGFAAGQDFIPLGTPGPRPAPPKVQGCTFTPVVDAASGRSLSDCPAYAGGATPAHTICADPSRQHVSDDMLLEDCHAWCEAAKDCRAVQWQATRPNGFDLGRTGQCFLVHDNCTETKPYDTGSVWDDFCMVIERCDSPSPRAPAVDNSDNATTAAGSSSRSSSNINNGGSSEGGAANPFDSHICFAAAHPIRNPGTDGLERIYYMGGNGPHSGERNSSFALATVRADGYAGLRCPSGVGAGRCQAVSRPVLCTGDTLVVTADNTKGAGGSVRVGVDGVPGLSANDSRPITTNATGVAVHFAGGASVAELIGRQVRLELVLEGTSMLYLVGFVNTTGGGGGDAAVGEEGFTARAVASAADV